MILIYRETRTIHRKRNEKGHSAAEARNSAESEGRTINDDNHIYSLSAVSSDSSATLVPEFNDASDSMYSTPSLQEIPSRSFGREEVANERLVAEAKKIQCIKEIGPI